QRRETQQAAVGIGIVAHAAAARRLRRLLLRRARAAVTRVGRRAIIGWRAAAAERGAIFMGTGSTRGRIRRLTHDAGCLDGLGRRALGVVEPVAGALPASPELTVGQRARVTDRPPGAGL